MLAHHDDKQQVHEKENNGGADEPVNKEKIAPCSQGQAGEKPDEEHSERQL
jgi:hypothetical protein